MFSFSEMNRLSTRGLDVDTVVMPADQQTSFRRRNAKPAPARIGRPNSNSGSLRSIPGAHHQYGDGVDHHDSNSCITEKDAKFDRRASLRRNNSSSRRALLAACRQSSRDLREALVASESFRSLADLQERPREETCQEIEIVPGQWIHFHGAKETWDAFCEGRVTHATCTGCNEAMYCINTASMVLCPCCRDVSPIFDTPVLEDGLGLGLTDESILEHLQQEEADL